MTVDIDKLRELAQAASQEKWEFWHGEVVHSVDNDGAVMVARRPEYSGGKRQKHHDANMQYIAAVNPQTILALLDELDRLRDALTDKDDLLRHIGDYAHDRSAGPAMPDDLWEVRRMAYEGYAS